MNANVFASPARNRAVNNGPGRPSRMNDTQGKTSKSQGLRHLNPRWEWSAEEIRRAGYRVVDMIVEHLTTLPEKPVF